MKNNRENVIREFEGNIKVKEMSDGRKFIIASEEMCELFQEMLKGKNNEEFQDEKYWDDTYEYHRVLELLHDYWLTEKDEAFVKINMEFRHADGQEQFKCIRWQNPNIDLKKTKQTIKIPSLKKLPKHSV